MLWNLALIVVWWLSLLYNFIQQSLNSGCAQVQILLAVSKRVGDSRGWESLKLVSGGSKAKRLSSVNHTTKQFIIIIIINQKDIWNYVSWPEIKNLGRFGLVVTAH